MIKEEIEKLHLQLGSLDSDSLIALIAALIYQNASEDKKNLIKKYLYLALMREGHS
jgi:hypothetical protein